MSFDAAALQLACARSERVSELVRALSAAFEPSKLHWVLWSREDRGWRALGGGPTPRRRAAPGESANAPPPAPSVLQASSDPGFGAAEPATADLEAAVADGGAGASAPPRLLPVAEAGRSGAWVLELAPDRDPDLDAQIRSTLPHLAAALLRIRRIEELERLASIDPVTGLFNARHLERVLQREVSRCERFGGSLCLLFLDLDHFKDVNDGLGHLVGTTLLADLGRVMVKTIRQTDYAFRYGGDEFAVLLIEASKASGARVADRVRRAVEGHARTYEDIRKTITASIGVATFPTDATSVDGLLQRADAAMYAAKDRGRNFVYTLDLEARSSKSTGQPASGAVNLSGQVSLPIILWDVMGTLVTEPFVHDVPRHFETTLEQLLQEKDPGAWIRFERGEIDEDEYCALFFRDRRAVDKAALKAAMQQSYDLMPGVEDLLSSLRRVGVPMYALSNYSAWYELIEEKLELSRWLSWDFVSCHTGFRKPEPEAYAVALERLEVSAERCVFVDDRAKNVEAARRMGMQAILRPEDPDALRAELVRAGVPVPLP